MHSQQHLLYVNTETYRGIMHHEEVAKSNPSHLEEAVNSMQ